MPQVWQIRSLLLCLENEDELISFSQKLSQIQIISHEELYKDLFASK